MKDLTPKHLRCIPVPKSCPGVWEMAGEMIMVKGPGPYDKETYVVLPMEYFAGLAREIVLRTTGVKVLMEHPGAMAAPSGGEDGGMK